MTEAFNHLVAASPEVFFKKNDPNDPRLGEIVPKTSYEEAEIVIVGCPQDEGVLRNNGRPGAAGAPDVVRNYFYRLTPFGISRKIADIGNIDCSGELEEVHDRLAEVAAKALTDGKRLIVLGGGNDISYADGRAMAAVFGAGNWLAVNVDAHFDVRADEPRNNGTPYRQLLDEGLVNPDYFYEAGYQPHLASPVYYRYLKDLGVHMISLDQLRSRATADQELRESMRGKFVHHSQSLTAFFGFDMDAVRASDAPGSSSPSPIGLRSGEFLNLVKFAASLANTRLIEFTEYNPRFDIDARTARLVAVGMHQFCSSSK